MTEVEKKARMLSNRYYNRGLDKAQIRDLSGAVDMLRRSIQLNKGNIPARNLLGLVYFEMGEAVAALSEWVISKNLREEDNIASEYIERLQENQQRLSVINQTIKSYNQALHNCKHGNEDVAAISLKKVVSQNPKFIKAYHLLALIYIDSGKLTRARKYLRKAQRIDMTNSTTLRYLKEIEAQLGTLSADTRAEMDDYEMRRIQVVRFHERSVWFSFLNIAAGLLIGVAAAWFLMLPSARQSARTDANRKVVEYSNATASLQTKISELEKQVEDSKSVAESANQQIEAGKNAAAAYENLLKAYRLFVGNRYTESGDALKAIDKEQLSADGKVIYEEIFNKVKDTVFKQLKSAAMTAYSGGDYSQAIDYLEKAREINSDDYAVLDYLALAYRAAGNKEKSIELFGMIMNQYPNTRRASSAKDYITQMGGDPEKAKEVAAAAAGTASDAAHTDTQTGTN